MKKVLVGGCFDVFHYGHLHFLREAKKYGDYLIIALEPDITVKKLKGPNRPIHDQNQRKEILESLRFVDEVIILKPNMNDKDYEKLVLEIKPDIIAVTKGDTNIEKKRSHAKTINANIIEIDLIQGYSTTKILTH